MSRKPASCPQIVLDWIAWYPEGDLPADVRSAIEVHAAECAACRQEIADLSGEGAVDAVAAAGAERVFARTLEKIGARPRATAPPARRRQLWIVRPRFALAAGVAVALVSGTLGMIATQQLHDTANPTYAPATGSDSAAHDGVAHLDVVFRDDASFAEIARAMQALGASVEAGPSPSGVVHLHLARGADAKTAAQRLETGDLSVAEFAQPAP
jgi:anti-sigma factor RsiW